MSKRKVYTIRMLADKVGVAETTFRNMIKDQLQELEFSREKRRYLTLHETNVLLTYLGFDKLDTKIDL